MVLERLDGALCCVAPMVVGWHKLEVNMLGPEVAFIGITSFIVEALPLWLETPFDQEGVHLVIGLDVLEFRVTAHGLGQYGIRVKIVHNENVFVPPARLHGEPTSEVRCNFLACFDDAGEHKMRFEAWRVHRCVGVVRVGRAVCLLGGPHMLALLVQMPFDCSGGLGEVFAYQVGREARPRDEVAIINGLDPRGWHRTATCSVKEFDVVSFRGVVVGVVCCMWRGLLWSAS